MQKQAELNDCFYYLLSTNKLSRQAAKEMWDELSKSSK